MKGPQIFCYVLPVPFISDSYGDICFCDNPHIISVLRMT